MVQLILAVGLTVVTVLFSMANTHHVALYYVFGEPVRVRLIFLLAIAFIAGSVLTLLYQLTERVLSRSRAKNRRAWATARARYEIEGP
ncbi:MAG: hypothetical protein OEZ06_18040 [Myxococcales bacterium]|nr:hypothetical protein [Myxococcales bacterium]